VLVDLLRGNQKAVALIQEHSANLMLSSIVAAELYTGVRNNDELEKLDNRISYSKSYRFRLSLQGPATSTREVIKNLMGLVCLTQS
jgi:hypothetical protein